ncbi:ATP-binding cassette domain-containing protein [Heliobacterium gestii]|uniref:ATP-binding cassette domain-containing protein n=1 Tax=Heliomicrobium gestii TaxID=2699 RepID=A0A845L802_HELGE|nr:ABC transporter ATP-binding protein [Heliomicrobium gestii]MBM7865457.1 ABC-2 type transport system ATP-binding protein [Heliomicrobium gestii]MZP41711.1 ATP-binding cassette domain-containing protein [Heliomicrobium gestii]
MNNAVEIQELVKTYGPKRILNRLSVEIPAGTVTALLGPNGAGKSTLFKILVGLAHADAGQVRVLGEGPSWRQNADIAYLPDRGHWYPFQTVGQAIAYAEQVFPRFNRAWADQMAAFTGLDLTMKVSALSKGQEARLQLLLCLGREAKLLLLDEPFSGIDLVSRERIIETLVLTMSERQDQTMVISTHEIAKAESLFDHVVFIDHGKIIQAERTDDLRSRRQSVESTYRRLFH